MLNLPSQNYTEAPLLRCLFSPDSDSFTFIFLTPSNIVRGFIREVDSVHFPFMGYKWKLNFRRTKMHIGVFLTLLSSKPPTNVEISLDMSLTILNREHFTKNQHHASRHVVFSQGNRRHGCRTLIELSDLSGGMFLADDHTFLFELELSNPKVNINVELLTTSELVRFLSNTYIDCFNTENSNHEPIIFESKPFSAGNDVWRLGVVMPHSSVFSPDLKEIPKVSMYIFQRRSKKSKSEQVFPFLEFSCEIDSYTSNNRMQFFMDQQTGMSDMHKLSEVEASAVTGFIREEISQHISKKVPFKYFNPILVIKLTSLCTRRIIPRKLILLSPESSLYFSTLPFDPMNTQWSIFAFHYRHSLSCGLQFEAVVKRKFLKDNMVHILWWSAYLGNGNFKNSTLPPDNAQKAMSVVTRFHQTHAVEMSMDSLTPAAGQLDDSILADALSPSQCLIKYPKDKNSKSVSYSLVENIDIRLLIFSSKINFSLLEWHI